MSYTLNKTGAQIDAIGSIEYQSTNLTSIANNTATNICSVDLTMGRWVVIGQFQCLTSSAAFQVSAGISTESATLQASRPGFERVATSSAQNSVILNMTRIVNVTDVSQTIYLVAQQNSGSDKSLTASASMLQAICITG